MYIINVSTTIICDSYRWWQRWNIGWLWLIFFNDWRPTQMHSFLQNVKVLNFVQPLRMYAIYIYNRTEMPKNHILTFVVWKPLFCIPFIRQIRSVKICIKIYIYIYINSFLQILCSLCQLLGNTSLNAKATPVILPFWYTCLNCLISMTWHPGDLFTALALLDFLWFLWNWPQITQACQFILDPKGVPLLPFCDSNLLRCDILQFRHKLSNT